MSARNLGFVAVVVGLFWMGFGVVAVAEESPEVELQVG